MSEQSVLTEFFAAAKSNQNFHAAKRRKVVTSNGNVLPKTSEKKVDVLCLPTSLSNTTFKASPATTSSKEGKRLSRKRTSQGRRTRKNVVVEKEIPEVVSSKATSIQDDHQMKRQRKQNTLKSNAYQNGETKKQLKEDSTRSHEKNVSYNEKISTATTNGVRHERVGELKINSWISDQAKIVLASRGKQALQKSLRSRSPDTNSKLVARPAQARPVPKPKETVNKVKEDIPRLHKEHTGSRRKAASGLEESGVKLPAYQRFSHLLEVKKPKPNFVPNLSLPYHFKMLEEFFRCVDVVLSLKQKRYENCTFAKLKESVQEMCRKTFEKKHLAQIKTVYPKAFIFHQQKGLVGQKKSDYQLTINFNMDELQADQKKKEFKFVESSILISRQKHFKKELLRITMDHHQAYLAKNYPSLSLENDKIMRWHPCFHLDEVPEISLSSLPEPPCVKTYSTAQDVLDRARQNLPPRVEKSLSLVAQKSKENNADNNKECGQNKNDTQSKKQNPSLKGVSQSLIEKIRQKEEKKIQETLTVDPVLVQKRVMVQRLPELCRILKSYFVSERKAAIPLEDANNKLSESSTSTLSPVQVEKHLKLLSELAPESVSIMHVRKCPYVKLKKNININILVEKLKSKEVN